MLTRGQWRNEFAVCRGETEEPPGSSADIYSGITDFTLEPLPGRIWPVRLKGIGLYFLRGVVLVFAGCPGPVRRAGVTFYVSEILPPT